MSTSTYVRQVGVVDWNVRGLDVANLVPESQDDAENGNLGSKLQHSPGRPVEGHEVLSITELQGQEAEGLHDNHDGRHGEKHRTSGKTSLQPRSEHGLFEFGAVAIPHAPGHAVSKTVYTTTSGG